MEIFNRPLQTLERPGTARDTGASPFDQSSGLEYAVQADDSGQLRLFNPDSISGDSFTDREPDTNLPVVGSEDEIEHNQLIDDFIDARNLYAYRAAGRICETIYAGRNKQFKKDRLVRSQMEYQMARHYLIRHEVRMAENRGEIENDTDLETIERHWALACDRTFTQAVRKELLAHTRDYDYEKDKNNRPVYDQLDGVVSIVEKDPGGIMRRTATRFHRWWGEQNETKAGRLRKTALMIGLGAAATGSTIVLAPLTGAVIGIAGTTAAANAAVRVSFSSAYYYLDGTQRKRYVYDQLTAALEQAEGHDSDGTYSRNSIDMTEILLRFVETESKQNKRRLKIAAGTIIAGTALGEVVHLFGVNILSSGNSKVTEASTTHTLTHPNYTPPKPPKILHKISHPHKALRTHFTGEKDKLADKRTETRRLKLLRHNRDEASIVVNPRKLAHEYVAQVFSKAQGARKGFLEMLSDAEKPIHNGWLKEVHPYVNRPGLFWYTVTDKGSEIIRDVKAGSTRTIDILKILARTGKLKLNLN
ncbi:MAG TPA: hypothetical protein VFN51_00700 [Candidatus Saccharimonadales bacterium]|nr:hypothetical protein [Candidatus Saccharimonadales bacterium]